MPKARRPPRAPSASSAPLAVAMRRAGTAIAGAAHLAAPHLVRNARATGRLVARTLAAASRSLCTHRALALALACRGLWWSALWILASAATALLGFTFETVDDGLWLPFAVGLALCTLVVLLASERHLRWLATGLGTTHALFGLLAFDALKG